MRFKGGDGNVWALQIPTGDRGSTASYTSFHSCAQTDAFSHDLGCRVNGLPSADAGTDQSLAAGATGQLDASGSSDPDGDSLTYSWTQISGPSVTLSDSSASAPQFTAPSEASTLVFEVTVTDAFGATHTAQVTITVTLEPVPEPEPEPEPVSLVPRHHKASQQAGTLAIGGMVTRMSEHVASTRVERHFRDGASTGQSLAASLDSASGWTAYSSDDFMETMLSYTASRNREKLEQLDPELYADFTANLKAANPWDNGSPVQFYTAGGYGSLDRDGAGDYEGFTRYTTAGLDYAFSDAFLVGGNVNWEWSEIDFANQVNGSLHKQGLRVEGYAGWQVTPGLFAEGLVSYAWLENQIDADSDKGDTSSERLMLQGMVTSDFDLGGARLSPYATGIWMRESFEAYVTDGGHSVSSQDIEMARGTFGGEIQSQEPLVWGLSPFIAVQGEWDWTDGKTVQLADGSRITPDSGGITAIGGLRGTISGMDEFGWLGAFLDGTQVDIDLRNAAFGREDQSTLLQWTLVRGF